MNDHSFASRGFNGPPRPSNQSALYAVVEGAKVFGNANAISPKALHWKNCQRMYVEGWKERAPRGSVPKPVKREYTSRKELKSLV